MGSPPLGYARRSKEILTNEGGRSFLRRATTVSRDWLIRNFHSARVRLSHRTDALADPTKVLELPPRSITYFVQQRDFRDLVGTEAELLRVVGGEWDQLKQPFEQSVVYQGCLQRFHYDLPWEETTYYETLTEQDMADPLAFLSQYDALYEDMATAGYRREYSIKALLGREGEFIRWNGSHRLSIARLLDIETVPVRVFVRHRRWQRLRDELVEDTDSLDYNQQILEHPDLQDLLSSN